MVVVESLVLGDVQRSCSAAVSSGAKNAAAVVDNESAMGSAAVVDV